MPVTYIKGADLPDLAVDWEDSTGDLIDFSDGWTFTVRVGLVGQTALFTKTTGITGSAASPNVTIAWDSDAELNTLTAGHVYTVAITATRDSDDRERKMDVRIYVKSTVEAADPVVVDPDTGISTLDGGAP
jgi:hypothetical protein